VLLIQMVSYSNWRHSAAPVAYLWSSLFRTLCFTIWTHWPTCNARLPRD